ncbi:hypothetical protein ACCF70_004689 [Vibrio parahaemolyticus]|nr:hypothetical protein [Vibrio parahaemolyticus]EJM7154275.1 hypothetical protein [Vibrio parahaemolyticus]EJY0899339.1 hypothetical protein [Vibrio parahaemolyticus]EKO5233781.1 hypothetical protein [Vibrio parahaemolyticus]ELA7347999.1 hypothetical protein [Vibrio parahaemolyticus]
MDKIAIIVSIFSAVIAFVALLTAVLNKKQDIRPWVIIERVDFEPTDDNFRLNAKVKHVSGGPALNFKFRTVISGKSDSQSTGTPTILPGQLLEMRSSNISGVNQEDLVRLDVQIEFKIEFDDAHGHPYSITQKITPSGKLFDYTPKVGRSFRTLWLKV